MTGPNDILDDDIYQSLIEELGLDLDFDEPVSKFENDQIAASNKLSSANTNRPFNSFEGDSSTDESSEQDGHQSGIEISADLLAELQNVIQGQSKNEFEFNEDANFVEDPIQVSGELDLASALMGAKSSKVKESKTEYPDTSSDADDSDDSEDYTSIFDNLDLSETALSKSDEPEMPEYDAATVEEEIQESWEQNSKKSDEFDPPSKEITSIDDLDSILENALSKEFEPPLGSGNFSDPFSSEKRRETPAFNYDADLDFIEEDEESYDDVQISNSQIIAAPEAVSRKSTVDTETKLNEFEKPEVKGGRFSLDDFADDADLLSRKIEPTPSVIPRLDDRSTKVASEYVAIRADAKISHDIDEELDFGAPQINGGDRVLPRIAIHAFCQTQTCLQMLHKTMQDRRMVNVSADIQEGGVAAAINYYQGNELPHMIIVESVAASGRLLAELDELAQYCDENVKIVVIGAANDIRLYRELMRRGVSEYIVPPLETVQLIRAIATQFADPEQPFMGKTLAVTGVKGGVGSSTIAHNLAWTLSERLRLGTTLVDLDLNFGTTGLDFNNETNQTIADALLAPERFDQAVMNRLITQATENLSLFTAPASLDRTYDLDVETYSDVLNKVRSTVPYVVLDLPHIWTEWFKDTVVSADEIVVVTQPDLASLRNGKNLIDFLKAARPNDSKPRLVINQVGVPKRPEIPVKDFAQAMGLEPDLVLPFDPQLFGTAANNGQMISDIAEDSKCSQGIDYLASLLTGREIKTERTSILNKLFKR